MRYKEYTPEQIKELKQNPYVKNCAGKFITFTPEAKIKAIELKNLGLSNKEVFRDLQFPEYVIQTDTPKMSIYRWSKIIRKQWAAKLTKETRGRKKWYRKIDLNEISDTELIQFYKLKVDYLEEKIKIYEWIKKKKITKSEKFSIINNLSNKYPVTSLCKIAQVSLSGYYAYMVRVKNNNTQEDREKEDLEFIRELVIKWKRKRGYRMITMLLYNSWRKMNHKKVLRLMKKYDLLSVIRQKNPYRWIMKANHEHRVFKNVLNRDFKSWKSFKKLWTDLTYLKYNGRNIYLSIVKDMISGEVLSGHLSSGMTMNIIEETLKKLSQSQKNHNIDFKQSIIHSDQWLHYTHPDFSWWIKKLWFTQSMSRRWNCLDNAPTESFFWHMKDEIDISQCKNLDEAKTYIDDYIYYYNNVRPQWNKKKKTPVEYRNYLLSQ